MVTSRYNSVEIGMPSSVKGFANRSEVHTSAAVELGKMAPGTARAPRPEESKTVGTHDDKVSFSNGGSIEDLPGESGLLLTAPNGEKTKLESHGWIDANWEENRIDVNFYVTNPYTGDSELWTQGLAADGSVTLDQRGEDDDSTAAEIGPDGQGSGEVHNYSGSFETRVSLHEDGAVLFDDCGWGGSLALAPAVPMEWLIQR